MIINFLKFISIMAISFLIVIFSYRTFISTLPQKDAFDSSKIQKVLEDQKLRFANKTYHQLLNLMPLQGDKPHVYTIKERDETYQLEVSSYWLNENKKGQDLLVYFSIYNTYRTAQNPLRDTIVKKRYE